MVHLTYPANGGAYLIDVAFGNQQRYSVTVPCLVDSGLTDPTNWFGFELEPSLYEKLKSAGQLSQFVYRTVRYGGGSQRRAESGLVISQLVDPQTRQRSGPEVVIYAARGLSNVPSRVGVSFFHRLTTCRVNWELDSRTWCIELP